MPPSLARVIDRDDSSADADLAMRLAFLDHSRQRPKAVTKDPARTLAGRLASEQGIALPLAMIIMGVFAVLGISVMYYTSAGSGASASSSASENAYALAGAGLNNALSVISVSTSDTTKVRPQPQSAGDTNSTVVTYTNGTATWGGSYDSSSRIWTIKSIGSVRNPNGPQYPNITRTLMASAELNGSPPQYTFVSLDTACDKHSLLIAASGQLTVTNPMYVNSCNASHDAFDIKGNGGSITAPAIYVVGGWEKGGGTTLTVGGVACSLNSASPPTTAAGCPSTGQPVISDPYAGQVSSPALGTPACTSPLFGSAASYSPTKQKLAAAMTAAQTTITNTGTAVQTGDYIQVESEAMLVTAGGGTTTLTVQRALNGTTAAAHGSGKEMKQVPVTTVGTAAAPAPCDIPSGTVTLTPGTYYGGICIGAAAGSDCGSNIGGTCTTTSSATANVTMAPGTYIMAGGGFFVCGSSTLSAPNVMIYNTQDPTNTAGSGAFDQIELNTTGSVALGPQTTGSYRGLTIFQDPALILTASTVTCDSKMNYSGTPSQSYISQWDIALVSMASTGSNGALGSVSGTIYAPANRSVFGDAVSGTANLAVLTSCMVIGGVSSTFNFQDSGLFGVGLGNVSQWGG
jgi:hypothetical protein